MRLGWLLGGPAALFLCAARLADSKLPHSAVIDLAFVSILVAMLGLRLVDVTYFGGRGVNGEPVTRRDLLRYVLRTVVIAAVVWGAATWLRTSHG